MADEVEAEADRINPLVTVAERRPGSVTTS